MINFHNFINENINEAFNFSKEEVLKVAHLVAHAIEKLDKAPTRVHDLEYDKGRGAGFGIQMYADKFAGGAYTVLPNGDVVNDAIGNSFPNAIYAKIGDTDVKKVMKNIQKFESVTNEARYNKKSLLKKLGDADTARIQTGNGLEYVINNPNNNADMWNDNSVFALDQDGEEHEIAYKDIGLVITEANNLLKQDALSPAEYQKAKKLKGFDPKNYKWDKNQDLYLIRKMNESAVTEGLDESADTIAKNMKKMFELVINEEHDVSGISREDLKSILNYLDTNDISYDFDGREEILDFDITELDKKGQAELKKLGISESIVTEGKKVTLKRRYTENYPAITAGKHARIRNKMLEAIGNDGKITQEEFDSILKELSNSGKRWTRNNSKYFNVSEEGISLSKFGKRALQSITVNEEQPETNDRPLEMKVNEKTTENPEIWVPGAFDKELSKMPNSQITYDVVKKLAKKHKVFLDDAIKYVEYGWDLDLNENMETQFIYESFNDFVNTLDESQSYASTFGGSSEKIDAVEIKKALKKAGYKTDTGGFWDRIFVKKGSNKIAMINTSDNMYRFNNSLYKWNGLKDFINHVSESVNEGKFQKDDLVYNTRTKTVGIVRIGDDEYGEVKTDADGNVDVDELEKYNPIKFKHQIKAKVAPSTEKEVSKRGLFNPFKNESVNEAKVNYDFSEDELKRVLKLLGRNASTEVKMIKAFEKAFGRKLTRDELFESVNEAKYTNQTGIKSALMKDSNFSSLLTPKEIKWINGSDVKIYKGIGMNFSFTDGKSQMIVNVNKPMSIVKKLGRAGNDIKKIYQQNESVVTESITKKDIKVGAEFQVGKDIFKVDEIEKDSKFGALVRSSRIESTSDKKYSYRDSMEEFVAFLNDEKAKVKK